MAGPGGRPSKYDPSYCDKLVEYGAQGYSLTACAGKLGVSRQTLHEWAGAWPEFSDAMARHAGARTAFLEEGLIGAETGPMVTSRMFALKNAAPHEWREKQDVELTGKDGGPIETKDVSDLEIARRVAFLLAKAGKSTG